MDREIKNNTKYQDALVKIIPSEIVAAFMVIDGLITGDEPYVNWLNIIVFAILLILIPLYLVFIYKIWDPLQILFTTLSFPVWVYWLGGPFKVWGIHYPQIASILLILWTLLIPLITLRKKYYIGQTIKIKTGVLKEVSGNICGEEYLHPWNKKGMTPFQGQEARITKIIHKENAVKLNIDRGSHIWAFEWIDVLPSEVKGVKS